mmetsp:Transcript_18359/g.56072  ORF Transcript_18359/g.56072 Transcript_18359/m.56072 type:complete len:242 (+) Transcript_18359:769-1494(+)
MRRVRARIRVARLGEAHIEPAPIARDADGAHDPVPGFVVRREGIRELDVAAHLGVVQEVLRGGAVARVQGEHARDELLERRREVARERGVAAGAHVAAQLREGVAEERRPQRHELVDEAARGPDVRRRIVRAVGPDLRAHVVGRTDLRLHHAVALDALRDVHVADLDAAVLAEEAVRRLDVAVHDARLVQVVQRRHALHEVGPDDVLVDVLAALAIAFHLGREVAAAAELHDDADLLVAFV